MMIIPKKVDRITCNMTEFRNIERHHLQRDSELHSTKLIKSLKKMYGSPNTIPYDKPNDFPAYYQMRKIHVCVFPKNMETIENNIKFEYKANTPYILDGLTRKYCWMNNLVEAPTDVVLEIERYNSIEASNCAYEIYNDSLQTETNDDKISHLLFNKGYVPMSPMFRSGLGKLFGGQTIHTLDVEYSINLFFNALKELDIILKNSKRGKIDAATKIAFIIYGTYELLNYSKFSDKFVESLDFIRNGYNVSGHTAAGQCPLDKINEIIAQPSKTKTKSNDISNDIPQIIRCLHSYHDNKLIKKLRPVSLEKYINALSKLHNNNNNKLYK